MLLKKFFYIFCICIGILANSYLALRAITGDGFLFVRLCNYFLPWFGLLALISLCGAALSKKRIFAIINAPLPIFIAFTYAPLFYNCCWDHSSGGQTVKVMSYNIHQYNQEMSKAADLITKQDPDILLIQEIEPPQFLNLMGLLAGKRKGLHSLFFEYEPSIHQAVVSLFPLKRVSFLEDKNRLLKVEAITPQGDITLLNIHAFKYGWRDRHERMERLLFEDVRPVQGPLILAGDFNTTDQSETIRIVTEHLNDAHQDAGCLFNFTFPSQSFFITAGYPIPPLLRIDYIFYSKHFRAVKSYTSKESGGSDHFPVIAELILKTKFQ